MHDSPGSTLTRPLERRGAFEEISSALRTVHLSAAHKVFDFRTARSERVTEFLRSQASRWVAKNYCRAFVLPDPEDESRVLGYYTLSPALLERPAISSQHQKKALPGIPVPLVRIGFMGRCDSAPKGLGAALVIDAAQRVYRNADLPAWGLVLDAEGGSANPQLIAWYESVGFKQAKNLDGVMYGPMRAFLPEVPFD